MPMASTYGLERTHGLMCPMVIEFTVTSGDDAVVISQYRKIGRENEKQKLDMEYMLVQLADDEVDTEVRVNVPLDKEFARRVWVALVKSNLFTALPATRRRRSSRSHFPKAIP